MIFKIIGNLKISFDSRPWPIEITIEDNDGKKITILHQEISDLEYAVACIKKEALSRLWGDHKSEV